MAISTGMAWSAPEEEKARLKSTKKNVCSRISVGKTRLISWNGNIQIFNK
jgi:hypothetical protein